jgi:hypothetical protein
VYDGRKNLITATFFANLGLAAKIDVDVEPAA